MLRYAGPLLLLATCQAVKNWNKKKLRFKLTMIFLPSYSFMKLFAYINAQYYSAISIYLFSWLHVLYDLRSINNDSKHAFSVIFISVFFWNINF